MPHIPNNRQDSSSAAMAVRDRQQRYQSDRSAETYDDEQYDEGSPRHRRSDRREYYNRERPGHQKGIEQNEHYQTRKEYYHGNEVEFEEQVLRRRARAVERLEETLEEEGGAERAMRRRTGPHWGARPRVASDGQEIGPAGYLQGVHTEGRGAAGLGGVLPSSPQRPPIPRVHPAGAYYTPSRGERSRYKEDRPGLVAPRAPNAYLPGPTEEYVEAQGGPPIAESDLPPPRIRYRPSGTLGRLPPRPNELLPRAQLVWDPRGEQCEDEDERGWEGERSPVRRWEGQGRKQPAPKNEAEGGHGQAGINNKVGSDAQKKEEKVDAKQKLSQPNIEEGVAEGQEKTTKMDVSNKQAEEVEEETATDGKQTEGKVKDHGKKKRKRKSYDPVLLLARVCAIQKDNNSDEEEGQGSEEGSRPSEKEEQEVQEEKNAQDEDDVTNEEEGGKQIVTVAEVTPKRKAVLKRKIPTATPDIAIKSGSEIGRSVSAEDEAAHPSNGLHDQESKRRRPSRLPPMKEQETTSEEEASSPRIHKRWHGEGDAHPHVTPVSNENIPDNNAEWVRANRHNLQHTNQEQLLEMGGMTPNRTSYPTDEHGTQSNHVTPVLRPTHRRDISRDGGLYRQRERTGEYTPRLGHQRGLSMDQFQPPTPALRGHRRDISVDRLQWTPSQQQGGQRTIRPSYSDEEQPMSGHPQEERRRLPPAAASMASRHPGDSMLVRGPLCHPLASSGGDYTEDAPVSPHWPRVPRADYQPPPAQQRRMQPLRRAGRPMVVGEDSPSMNQRRAAAMEARRDRLHLEQQEKLRHVQHWVATANEEARQTRRHGEAMVPKEEGSPAHHRTPRGGSRGRFHLPPMSPEEQGTDRFPRGRKPPSYDESDAVAEYGVPSTPEEDPAHVSPPSPYVHPRPREEAERRALHGSWQQGATAGAQPRQQQQHRDTTAWHSSHGPHRPPTASGRGLGPRRLQPRPTHSWHPEYRVVSQQQPLPQTEEGAPGMPHKGWAHEDETLRTGGRMLPHPRTEGRVRVTLQQGSQSYLYDEHGPYRHRHEGPAPIHGEGYQRRQPEGTPWAGPPPTGDVAPPAPQQRRPKEPVVEKVVLRRKFSWKNYPELEAFLIANREEYLRHSALNYTMEQKQYNNRLTERLLEVAARHNYVFDEDVFDFVSVRDRIRCYYKSFVQSSKKRGVLIGYGSRKKAGLVPPRKSGKEDNKVDGKTEEEGAGEKEEGDVEAVEQGKATE